MSEKNAPVEIHRLVNKDPQTRTGECSVCGLVAIAKSGRGFMCGEKKKAVTRAWRQANPEKSRADRKRRSDHELFNQDPVKLTASCAKCGPVTMVFWGRGYACSVRASELREVQETSRQEACRECWILEGDRVYPVNGVCPRCNDPRRLDTGAALRDAEYRQPAELEGMHGFTVVDLERYDAEAMDDDESVVAGWSRRSGMVLGSHTRAWNEV